MTAAGSAEVKGDGTLSQQKADSVFDKLSTIAKVNMPVRQFAGAYDNTAGQEGGKKTTNELVKLGDTNAKIAIVNTDHSGMSTQPFSADLLNWLLQQKRSGASSNGEIEEEEPASTDSSSLATETSSTVAASASASTTTTKAGNALFTPSVSSGSATTQTHKVACRQRRARRSDIAELDEVEAQPTIQRGLTLDNILARRAAHQASLEMAAHQAEAERRRALANEEQAALVKRNLLSVEKVTSDSLAALKRHTQRAPVAPHAGVRLRRR